VAHVAVSNLAYAHPGGDLLFSGVSFRIASGSHVGIVGANGVGKSTLMRVLAGELVPKRERPRSGAASRTWAGAGG
jgi:ATPase subunit of ABC transporter with duplicated ATPase domains